jgi:hypothetical protein
MRGNSIISQSGQIWKVVVGLTLLIGGAVAGVSVSFVSYLRAVTINLGATGNINPAELALAAAGGHRSSTDPFPMCSPWKGWATYLL